MKARVLAINEIRNVTCIGEKYGVWQDEKGFTYYARDLDFNVPQVTEEDTTPCDLWEQRKYEISKACLTGIIANARFNIHCDIGDKAKQAIRYADALIAELKKKK